MLSTRLPHCGIEYASTPPSRQVDAEPVPQNRQNTWQRYWRRLTKDAQSFSATPPIIRPTYRSGNLSRHSCASSRTLASDCRMRSAASEDLCPRTDLRPPHRRYGSNGFAECLEDFIPAASASSAREAFSSYSFAGRPTALLPACATPHASQE